MTAQNVTVVNQLGMHARAAAKFVHLAAKFEAHIRVARDAREMDGKSIMGLLLLAAGPGNHHSHQRRRGETKRKPSRPWSRSCKPDSARMYAAYNGHRRVARRGGRPRRDSDSA